MSEPKHTPGPWAAEESEIFDAAGWRVAETSPSPGDGDLSGFSARELANAHLIAAAPDGYAAAVALTSKYRASHFPSYMREEWRALEAFVAKAEGRS